MKYSQYMEEEHILGYFGATRARFLDVGAHDGKQNSNTRALYENGWGGVCVEPEKTSYNVLADTYVASERVTCANVAITPGYSGEVLLHSHGGQVATLVDAHRRTWEERGFCYVDVPVQAWSVKELLTRHPGPYEFINIDAEGMSFDIALAIPFSAIGCRLVCIEIDREVSPMLAYLAKHGLSLELYRSDNLLVGAAQ